MKKGGEAMAKCGFCNAVGTRLELISPRDANYKQAAICCSSCGAILGVVGATNPTVAATDAQKSVRKLSADVSNLQRQLDEIRQLLRRR